MNRIIRVISAYSLAMELWISHWEKYDGDFHYFAEISSFFFSNMNRLNIESKLNVISFIIGMNMLHSYILLYQFPSESLQRKWHQNTFYMFLLMFTVWYIWVWTKLTWYMSRERKLVYLLILCEVTIAEPQILSEIWFVFRIKCSHKRAMENECHINPTNYMLLIRFEYHQI